MTISTCDHTSVATGGVCGHPTQEIAMSDDKPKIPTPASPRDDWQDSLAGFLLGAEAETLPEPPVADQAEVKRPKAKTSR